jgi:hypothetical protein
MSEVRSRREGRAAFAGEMGSEPDWSRRLSDERNSELLRDEDDQSAFDGPTELVRSHPDYRIGLYILTDDDFVALAPDATASDPEPERALGEFIEQVSGASGHADLIEPVDAPNAPAALACVETVLEDVARALDVPVPGLRWYRAWPSPGGKTRPTNTSGFVVHGEPVVWLSVAYSRPQALAVTAAHELVHYWQDQRSGRCVDAMEHREREGEARRRANVLVPKGTFRTPRGKKLDAWFEPARRRYGTHGGYFCP